MVSESSKSFKYKCPGSLMIMGEHAVLHGKPAIVASINKYLEVTLELLPKDRNHDSRITIKTALEQAISYTEELSKITIVKPLDYILAVITHFKPELAKFDFNYQFTVNSQINHKMGLGSSAAITVATIAVILDFLEQDLDKYKILAIGKEILLKVQGSGSGADLAASLFTGVLWYEMQPAKIERLIDNLPLIVVYSGYKLSTANVIARVNQAMANNNYNIHYSLLFDLIANLVCLAKHSILKQNWHELGQLFNIHYGLQEALAVSDQNLSNIVYKLRSYSNILGAKISGSGLGDCVIGLCENMDSINLHNIQQELTENSHAADYLPVVLDVI
jgi:mevalonate kinase